MLLLDSYKISQHSQYPPGTERIYSYLECRAGASLPETVFFGLQILLKSYLRGRVVTAAKVDAAATLYAAHFGSDKVFSRPAWEHVAHDHGGRLPLTIRAVPEGTRVPTGNVLMTVENTCNRCAWLTSCLETLLTHVWYPSTVATRAAHMRALLKASWERTGAALAALPRALHDFGMRATSGPQEAARGGAAHLLSFAGTDNPLALQLLQTFYGAQGAAGYAVPASEHSTMTSWTRAGEADAYAHMLRAYPKGVVSVVSDSWDIFHACKALWGGSLKAEVLQRDGIVVIRPDSGDPVEVLPRVLALLGDAFGVTTNARGFRVLHPKIAVLQGDGINLASLPPILAAVEAAGWCSACVVFGSGGGLLRQVDRDMQRFAFKCAWAQVNGTGRNVYKDPVTARRPGAPTSFHKASKAGRLKLVHGATRLETVAESAPGDDVLEEVFRDGELRREETLTGVRERLWPVGGR